MTSSPSIPPPLPATARDEGASALVAAMETAPAAIYVLDATAAEPIWANARARDLGTARDQLPVVDGRPVTDVLDEVLRTGQAETICGPLGRGGPAATVMARPMQVAGGPGVLLVLESEDAATDTSLWPSLPADGVEQAQLSLLPPSLPLLPDLRLSGSYHRASAVRAAGGDWYDTVALGSGRVALVVGDAVGHGVPAAGAMSRLRGAMRSSALRDPSPAAVLAALDTFAAQMEDVEGTSVFYGVLDAGTGDLVYAAAGHPPPLVVGADGTASFLPVPPRPPLGSLPGTPTTVSRHVLDQGSTLVLFSNGAVAGPGPEASAALDRLAEAATSVLASPDALAPDASGELASAIAEGVRTPDGWLDDVAVLVAHRREDTLEPLQLDLIADPAALPGVRRRLNSWLTTLGMGEQDRVGAMVAVGEACANAAEHAYRGSEPGPMSVTARVDVDGVLTVTVRDEGTWRPPNRDPGDRGRGLLIMRQLVDGVVLEEEEKGTTVTLSLRLRRSPEVDEDRPSVASAATVTVDRGGPRPVVRASGAVDELGAEQMRIRLLEASHGGTGRVELDLGGVSLFSSAAVRVVLAIARIGRDEGWRLVVHAPDGGITRHILEISGLGGLVDLR
ncbi:SpoIIE family protein phosphatase [Blastococcus mobilis]|uniref:Anti-anti-sigma factor n=1 Tax=Blastococcus mobilis TaxID=1938746 RepID=A0A238ULR1_9ACTN|nr:SpoIIE family protein phosphatase [Blastococcus mobilis]SNR23056.1 anti-anti-sigma factor [Blastococcus mobilis]